MLQVVASGGGTQLQGGCIFLGMRLELLYLLGAFAGTEHQHTGGKRVERSRMTYLHLMMQGMRKQIANMRQRLEARHAIGFVDGYDFSFLKVHKYFLE